MTGTFAYILLPIDRLGAIILITARHCKRCDYKSVLQNDIIPHFKRTNIKIYRSTTVLF